MPPEGDPTQHAELSAAAEAARKTPAEELSTAALYTSSEPCVMCTGAIYWTGIGRIVYALSESSLVELTGDDPENPTSTFPAERSSPAGNATSKFSVHCSKMRRPRPTKDSGSAEPM